jgi:hypothetical protein
VNFLRIRGLDVLPEIEAASAVACFTRRELMQAPNFGKGAAAAVTAWLARHDLTLRTP